MNTGPAERLSYRELARQGAQLTRVCAARDFERLSVLLGFDEPDAPAAAEQPDVPADGTDSGLAPIERQVEIELAFRVDEEGLAWVEGSARLAAAMLCHRCAESVSFPMSVGFALCLVDELKASELAETRDVLVVSGTDVSIAEVVEDELLLALPERLCSEEPCARLPALAYPAAGAATDETSDKTEDGPFAALRALKGPAGEGG